jgi:hypothetical protein
MYAKRGNRKRWVGASVHYGWSRALDVWPRTRFVHLLRDGRDVGASWIRLGWEGNTYAGARTWRASMAEWERVRARLPSERVLDVWFEELVRDPEVVLGRICAFIGTEYHPAMLEYPRDTSYGPIRRDQAEKWRTSLTDWEVRVFESVAGEELVANGYELSGLPPVPLHGIASTGLRVEAGLRRNLARLRFFGPTLWLSEHVTRRLPLGRLRERVQLRMNAVTDASLK